MNLFILFIILFIIFNLYKYKKLKKNRYIKNNRYDLVIFGCSYALNFNKHAKTYSYSGSTCRGLINANSTLKTGDSIINNLHNIDLTKNKIILFFGNVDLLFSLIYNYNKYVNFNAINFVEESLIKYMLYIDKIRYLFPNINLVIFGIYNDCFDDNFLLNISKNELYYKYIQKREGITINNYVNPTKIISKNKRSKLIKYFNSKLKYECKIRNITFKQVYNICKYKKSSILLDHHYDDSIMELWEPILSDIRN